MRGILRAGNMIMARVLGSELSVPTKIAVGFEPQAKKRLESLKKEKASLAEYLVKTEGGIRALEECMHEGSLSARRSEMYDKLLALREQLHNQTVEVDTELAEAQAEVAEAVTPEIKVSGTAYPNTTINIKGANMLIGEMWHNVTFYEQEGEVRVMPLA